jgi:hypothetical protein
MSLHSFEVEHARKYGLAEAVLIKNFKFWIEHNIDQKYNFKDGRTWTYISLRELAKNFDYLSEKQVRTAIDHLVNEGVILKGNYNKLAIDKTLWYAFVNESEFVKPYDLMGTPFAQMGKPDAQEGEAIPDTINIYSNTNNKKENIKRKKVDFEPPTLDEVKRYFIENGYSPIKGEQAFNYYSSSNWMDKNNKPVLNWKLKMQIWFKPEDKIDVSKMAFEVENPEQYEGYNKWLHVDAKYTKSLDDQNIWRYKAKPIGFK